MQRFEQEEDKTKPVGRRRVTAAELTRALNEIEDDKEQEARMQAEREISLADTLTLDEAVTELSLNSTQDQIWDKVSKIRVREQSRAAMNVQHFGPNAAYKTKNVDPTIHPESGHYWSFKTSSRDLKVQTNSAKVRRIWTFSGLTLGVVAILELVHKHWL